MMPRIRMSLRAQAPGLSFLRLASGLCLVSGIFLQSAAPSERSYSECGYQAQKPLQEAASVTNIEIPVRVLKGATFVDHLTINDFEVFENGKPQQIEAVYLIQKTDIKREEGQEGSPRPVERPQLARQFVLLFDMSDYMPEVGKALDYFFDKVVLPGDSLMVITPMGQYRMRSDAFAKRSSEEIKQQLQGRLRHDIINGSAEYRSIITALYKILNNDQEYAVTYAQEKIQLYTQYLNRLEALRKVDEKSLLQFAGVLKSLPGQKYVYMFHQMEIIPQYKPAAVAKTMAESQDDFYTMFSYMEYFEFYTRSIRFNVEAVKKAYADSSITVHFLFITKTAAERIPLTEKRSTDPRQDVTMVEHSEDIFSAFGEVARATGGISETSANAAAAFEKAVNASENYYLIYYKPKDYKADGKFHEIKVKVKGGGYSVTHRAGYIAK
jgi:VWFA-related protein